jgi:hypothetical protein
MRIKTVAVVALGVAALLVAGGLFASNMGFKLNYPLDAPGTNGSLSGTNSLALPFNQQTNLVDAEDLIGDINLSAGSSVVSQVARFVRTSDSTEFYTGAVGTNFPLASGEGYLVKVTGNVNYIVVGSHNPSLGISFDAPGSNGSLSGTNSFAFPYHGTASTAEGLIADVNASAGSPVVTQVARFVKSTDSTEFYTGSIGTNFSLTPGEFYYVKVSADVTYAPSHY